VLADPLKGKQLSKALDQLSEEGAVQVFRPIHSNEQFLGVVGPLQFEIVLYRIKAEYGVQVKMAPLGYAMARWLASDKKDALEAFIQANGQNICKDQHDHPTILINESWQLRLLEERNPDIKFLATSE
jgi:peptide chain release factor 3